MRLAFRLPAATLPAVTLLAASLLLGACVSEKRANRATVQTQLGAAYYREGNPEGAIETLEEATKLNPRDWEAWNMLAIAYIEKGGIEEAEHAFRKARRFGDDRAEVLNNYGTFLLKQGRTDEAIEVLVAATKDLEYRSPALVLSNLSYAYYQAGRYDEGIATAREAVRRSPDVRIGGHCEARFHAGLNLEGKGDLAGAREAYTGLMTYCPEKSLGARLRVGCMEIGAGNGSLGAPLLQEVVDEAPDSSIATEARSCLGKAG